jgi:hypothetical protein
MWFAYFLFTPNIPFFFFFLEPPKKSVTVLKVTKTQENLERAFAQATPRRRRFLAGAL